MATTELRKKAPMIGRLPSPGNLSTAVRVLLVIRPLMTKLSPSAREILVSVRRTVRPGTWVPAMVTAVEKSSSLTSGATFMVMRLRLTTVGDKARRTPNSLYSIDTESLPVLGTGMGISPPARKLAVRPLSTTRLGLARV
ncbi:hypothetical protein D9M73_233480 [compost metagenome]